MLNLHVALFNTLLLLQKWGKPISKRWNRCLVDTLFLAGKEDLPAAKIELSSLVFLTSRWRRYGFLESVSSSLSPPLSLQPMGTSSNDGNKSVENLSFRVWQKKGSSGSIRFENSLKIIWVVIRVSTVILLQNAHEISFFKICYPFLLAKKTGWFH